MARLTWVLRASCCVRVPRGLLNVMPVRGGQIDASETVALVVAEDTTAGVALPWSGPGLGGPSCGVPEGPADLGDDGTGQVFRPVAVQLGDKLVHGAVGQQVVTGHPL